MEFSELFTFRVLALAVAATVFTAPAHALPVPPKATGHQLICWASGLGLDLDCEGRGGIFVMRTDGSQKRQLTSFTTCGWDLEEHGLNMSDDHPSFSPDGKQIVFTSKRSSGGAEEWDIHLMDVNGGNIRRLAPALGLDTEPSISPDGTTIVFASARSAPSSEQLKIWSMTIDGTGLKQLSNTANEDVEPSWKPDGSRIFFSRIFPGNNKEIMSMKPDGTDVRRLTNESGEDHDATCSPDGTELVFTSERAFTLPYGDIWVIDSTTGAAKRRLTTGDGLFEFSSGDPAWSPDGSKIAFFTSTGPIARSPQRLGIMNANGTGRNVFSLGFLVNVHPNMGYEIDTDSDGRPDHMEARNRTVDETLWGVPGVGHSFGSAAAVADLSNDGQLDIIIGAPGEPRGGVPGAGRIFVGRGTPEGFDLDPEFGPEQGFFNDGQLTLPEMGLPAEEAHFGQAIVSGKFADGVRTIAAVSAPGRGEVHLIVIAGQNVPVRFIGPARAGFGEVMTVGDFNDDGLDDLVVASPREVLSQGSTVLRAGAVRIYYGRANIFSNPGAVVPQIIDQGDLPLVIGAGREEVGDEFGAALAVGDLNFDGVDDLVIGVPGESIDRIFGTSVISQQNAGLIHVIPGVKNGQLNPAAAISRDQRHVPAFKTFPDHASARFGASLAVGRFGMGTLNGSRELAVGLPGRRDGGAAVSGLIAVFGNNLGGLAAEAGSVIGLAQLGQPHGLAHLGTSLIAAEFTGDGFDDLVATAPFLASGSLLEAGAIFLIPGKGGNNPLTGFGPVGIGGFGPGANPLLAGSQSTPPVIVGGLSPSSAQLIRRSAFGAATVANQHFGGSAAAFTNCNMLAAGDIDRDGQADLIIGTPRTFVSGKANAGSASIRFGVPVGIFTAQVSAPIVAPDQPVDLTLRWQHPRNWNELDRVEIRAVSDFGTVASAVFDQTTGDITFLEPISNSYLPLVQTGPTSSVHQLWATLWSAGSGLTGSGVEGQEMTMTLRLSFSPLVEAQQVRFEVRATDDDGNTQGFTEVARIGVLNPTLPVRLAHPRLAQDGVGDYHFLCNAIAPGHYGLDLEWSTNLTHWAPAPRLPISATGIGEASFPYQSAGRFFLRSR